MSGKADVYFDHNATTPLDPRVRAAMLPWLREEHGNPSSAHRFGREARQAVEVARAQVAALLGAESSEMCFVASGSEANNMVFATFGARSGHRGHLILSALEHPSVRAAAARLGACGMTVSEFAPGEDGRVDPATVQSALRDDTRLVAAMLANNELGTLQPVAEIAELCRRRGVPVLCDAVQAVGKIPVDVRALGVDYLTLGGHKFHGPPGVAALWRRPGAPLEPLVVGASQEGGMRAGTENVPGIVGLGRAAEIAANELAERHATLVALQQLLEDGLARIPDALVHCARSPRLPHTTHVAFPGLIGHELMLHLDAAGFAVSTGAACHAGRPQPSRALLAMGLSEAESLASIRVSFGLTNRPGEVTRFLAVLGPAVQALRSTAVPTA